MGSLYRNREYWVFQYYSNGNREYVQLGDLGDLTKQDRKELKRKYEVQYEDGQVRTKNNLSTKHGLFSTINIYLLERDKKVRLQTLSSMTVRGDRRRLGYFTDFVKDKFGNIEVEDLSDKVLNDYMDYCSDERNNNKTTIHNNLKVIQGFLKYCDRKGYLISNPYKMVDIPRPNKKVKEDIPTKKESNTIKEYLNTYIDQYLLDQEKFNLIRVTSYIQIRLGMRIGEIFLMKWKQGVDDVGDDHSYSYVYINSTLNKLTIHFKRKLRYLQLDDRLKNLFTKIKVDTQSKVFVLENRIRTDKGGKNKGRRHKQYTGKKYNSSYPSRPFKTMLRFLDIDDKYSTHSLRHGFVTDRWRKGHSLSHIGVVVGHSDVRMTEVYGHLDITDVMSVLDDD